MESGTHDELLLDPSSAYSGLIQAQQLRDAAPTDDDDSILTIPVGIHPDYGMTLDTLVAEEGTPADATPEASCALEEAKPTAELSASAALRRIMSVNLDQWPKYLFGLFFAVITVSSSHANIPTCR